MTMGVEEEFILVDRETRHAVRQGAAVVLGARDVCGVAHVEHEMAQAQVECVGGVCGDRHELLAELLRLRRGASACAASHGCMLVASGTSILGDPGPAPILDKPRYAQISERFGPIVQQQCVSACHVHIGVPEPEEAVQVANHLRLWTPLLLALSANSPFWLGADTAYASWRTSLWGRWPTSGPPPYLRSAQHYENVVDQLVDSGAAMDPAMLYWYVRPSRHVPTVEVRVADVMPTAHGTTAFALLVRAMAADALMQVRQGRTAHQLDDVTLRAACWQASRGGARGRVLATAGGADDVVPTLVWAQLKAARVSLAGQLDHFGDQDTVLRWLAGIRRHGTGADLQRAARNGQGGLESVVDAMAVTTASTHNGDADAPNDTKER